MTLRVNSGLEPEAALADSCAVLSPSPALSEVLLSEDWGQ